MKVSQTSLWRLALFVALVALAIGCSGDSPADDAGEPATGLECGGEGYPCSFSEVPIEVLERSDAIGDEIVAMLDDGATMADVEGWPSGQDGVVEVQWDESVVRYRLDGGRAFWVWGSGVFGTRGALSAGSGSGYSRPTTPVLNVVGEDSPAKQALVLSPILWEYPDFDDGSAVASILAGTRGYEGGVEHRFNNDMLTVDSATGVTIDSFTSWGDYDVIHVTTHGAKVCDENVCRASIAASTLDAVLPEGSEAQHEKIHELEEEGLEIAKTSTRKPDGTLLHLVVLPAEFFRKAYGGGLNNTFVFINACETFGVAGTDLSEALMGSTGVYMGWTEAVWVDEAMAASVALYTELSEGGYTAEVAHAHLDVGLRVGDPPGPHPAPALMVGQPASGGDLRIRDVVWVLDPATSEVLAPSGEVVIEGVTGDGQPDSVPYLIQVDGVVPEDAADVTVHVSIDGVEAEPEPLLDNVVNGEDQWFVDGVIDLGYDVDEGQEVIVHAWVELHSGGESHHEVPATLTGSVCIVGTWSVNGGDVARIHGTSPALADVAESVSVEGSVIADFAADGTVSYQFNDFEIQTTTATASAIPGVISDLRGEDVFASSGTATGTWALSEDGLLAVVVGDYATTVTISTKIEAEGGTLHDETVSLDPPAAALYVIPDGVLAAYQCTENTLVIAWASGQPVSWTRMSG